MKQYYYFLRTKPKQSGDIPNDGLISYKDREIWYDGVMYFGEAVYSRELSKDECNRYGLDLHKVRQL